MSQSRAEIQRRYRKRRKEAIDAAPDKSQAVIRRSVAFLKAKTLYFEEGLDSLGVRIDGTPLYERWQTFSTQAGVVRMSSLERATGLVGVFLDAARELAVLINDFKLEELDLLIQTAIDGLASLDTQRMSDAVANIERLRAMRNAFGRRDRHDIPVIALKELPGKS